LHDISYRYQINGLGFTITPQSPGKIFIDSTDVRRTKFFSFDGVFELRLTVTTQRNNREK